MKILDKKILLTNGCSYTWGGGLEPFFNLHKNYDLNEKERLKLVWPHHLGLLMNRTPINLGMGCGSNERIVRTTVEWLSSQSLDTLNNTIAVIQWTEYFRSEYYIPKIYNSPFNTQHHGYNHNFENMSDRWVLMNSWGHSATDKNKKIANKVLRSKIETYSNIQKLFEHVQQCLTLAYLFEKYNIKYCFWQYEGNIHFWPQQYFNLIKDLKWLSYENFYDYEIIGEHDPHPSVNGHKQIAKKLHSWFKNET